MKAAEDSHLDSKHDDQLHSAYLGWTGEQSQPSRSSFLGSNRSRLGHGKTADIRTVELDTTFAKTLDLVEAQQVDVLLHLEPPSAYTIHIEPLTPGDWEIIELHSKFLEDNLLLQVRALPNPSVSSLPSETARKVHPITLHLSPTSTANIIVSSLVPPQSPSTPFVKVAPGAEVIVAPKTRPRASNPRQSSNRSIGASSKKSKGNISTRGQHVRRKAPEDSATYLRAVDCAVATEWLAEDTVKSSLAEQRLEVLVANEVLKDMDLTNSVPVSVAYVRPAALEANLNPQEEQSKRELFSMVGGRPALTVIAQIRRWRDAPDEHHCALSSTLASALGVGSIVGGLVRLRRAPNGTGEIPRSLQVFPFAGEGASKLKELRFGGESKAARHDTSRVLQQEFGSKGGLLDGPLTDGMFIKDFPNNTKLENWHGGILRFDPRPTRNNDHEKQTLFWHDFSGLKVNLDVQPEVPNLLPYMRFAGLQDFGLPQKSTQLVGVEDMAHSICEDVLNECSVLLTGGIGSGKTAVIREVGWRLRSTEFLHISHMSCRDSFSDETRVSVLKEKLDRLFAGAAWAARPTGQSLIIIDDLDKICPAETELQTQDNGRSRQVAELLLLLTKQYCGYGSSLAVLTTAQSKESVHNLIISAGVVRNVRQIKAPHKDQRRKILEAFIGDHKSPVMSTKGHSQSQPSSQETGTADWLSASPTTSSALSPNANPGFNVSPSFSLLKIASLTDGYSPGDLALLLSRAKSESLIRSPKASHPTLTHEDFQAALRNFTPASLRSVTLHTSTASFSSIGGLEVPRRILLETLQYPTKYAPLFAHCSLRLRSGILLYGYPGCGKTLLASAIAAECGLNFISVKGPEILNKYIGASEKSIRDLFDRAQAAKPCVLFFDEFDSIAPKRGHDSTGVTDRVVNQLLTQMDGAEGLEGVYVLAATSRPDLIDPALLRPGRLDKSVICGMPLKHERKEILGKVAENLRLEDEAEELLEEVAIRTEGYSGADLQAVMYNAHLEAVHDFIDGDGTRQDGKRITNGDHQNGRDVMTGDHTNKVMDEGTETDDLGSANHDILCFQLGDEDPVSSPLNTSTHSKSAIRADLAALDATRSQRSKQSTRHRTARAASYSSDSSASSSTTSSRISSPSPSSASKPKHRKDRKEADKKPEIQAHHILSSLSTTRPSISSEERMRLRRIYEDFMQSRDGEMRDGSGTTEVGGRTTLM